MNDDFYYVIRSLAYWYTDEFYTTAFDANSHYGHIEAIFEDKNAALAHWQQLEYSFAHHPEIDFNHLIHSGYSVDDPQYRDRNFLKQLSTTDLFSHLQNLEQNMFALYQYPKQSTYPVVKNERGEIQVEHIQMEDDFRTQSFLHHHFATGSDQTSQIQPLVQSERCIEQVQHILYGDLAELTDTPLLLQHLIEQNTQLEYDPSHKKLSLRLEPTLLAALNALLKHPIEIEYLNLMQIFQYEQNLDSIN